MNDKTNITISNLTIHKTGEGKFNLRYYKNGVGNLSQERVDVIRLLDELVDCLMRLPAHMSINNRTHNVSMDVGVLYA